ncbi:MAG: hypothetical protein WC737_05715 [Parcubacteria group bacterium]|jgi:hypothetical protein
MKNIIEKLKAFLLSKRVRSFCWRLGMMMLAAGIDFVLQNLAGFNLGPEATIALGLVLGEISKALHNKYKTK